MAGELKTGVPDEESRRTYEEFVEALRPALAERRQARDALVRHLLALSSGSLVATVSLMDNFVSSDTRWLSLLATSWIFFGIAVLACLVHVATFTGFEAIMLRFRLPSPDARALVSILERLSSKDTVARVVIAQAEVYAKEDEQLRYAAIALIVAYACFLLGLVTLGTFAVRNLPWP